MSVDRGWIGMGAALEPALEPVLARCAMGAIASTVSESPIETIFGGAVLFRLSYMLEGRLALCTQDEAPARGDLPYLLIPQFWWSGFRIDWVLRVLGLEQPYIFVECDGQEFHSSPADVARDRRKDAAARDAGITVLRFTGTDIVRNSEYCAHLLLDTARSMLEGQSR